MNLASICQGKWRKVRPSLASKFLSDDRKPLKSISTNPKAARWNARINSCPREFSLNQCKQPQTIFQQKVISIEKLHNLSEFRFYSKNAKCDFCGIQNCGYPSFAQQKCNLSGFVRSLSTGDRKRPHNIESPLFELYHAFDRRCWSPTNRHLIQSR